MYIDQEMFEVIRNQRLKTRLKPSLTVIVIFRFLFFQTFVGKLLLTQLELWSKRIKEDPDSIDPKFMKPLRMEKNGLTE